MVNEPHLVDAYVCMMRNEKETRAIDFALYRILAQKRKKKNDSLEGGVRKRAETEEKSVETRWEFASKPSERLTHS